MKKCAVCVKQFYPEQKHYYLCSDCWDDYKLLGDTEYGRYLHGISLIINSKIKQEQLEMIAGFGSVSRVMSEWLDGLDPESRLRLLKKEINKLKG